MRNGPFQALQDLYLYDPMTGKPKPDANLQLLKVAEMGKAQDKMISRLKSMRVQAISKEPEWENCINISLPDDIEVTASNKDAMFNALAGNLVHKNKIPLEIAKFKNSYFVRTENVT